MGHRSALADVNRLRPVRPPVHVRADQIHPLVDFATIAAVDWLDRTDDTATTDWVRGVVWSAVASLLSAGLVRVASQPEDAVLVAAGEDGIPAYLRYPPGPGARAGDTLGSRSGI